MRLLDYLLDISPAATRQTEKQAGYYRQQSGENLAARWVKAVSNAVRGLRELPERGALCAFQSPDLKNTRRVPVRGFDRFLVFYKVDIELKVVIILGVHHGARDLEVQLLQQDEEPGLEP